eukprot:6561838-Ditylum_brightwellii.AAC.1
MPHLHAMIYKEDEDNMKLLDIQKRKQLSVIADNYTGQNKNNMVVVSQVTQRTQQTVFSIRQRKNTVIHKCSPCNRYTSVHHAADARCDK